MASIRKRAAKKGDVVVEVKPGEEVVSVNVSWTVEKFVEGEKEVEVCEGESFSQWQGKDIVRERGKCSKKVGLQADFSLGNNFITNGTRILVSLHNHGLGIFPSNSGAILCME